VRRPLTRGEGQRVLGLSLYVCLSVVSSHGSILNKQLYQVREQAIKDGDENIDDGPSSHACTMMRRHKLNSFGESFADLPLVPNNPPSASYLLATPIHSLS
jgi:hypothetical protein